MPDLFGGTIRANIEFGMDGDVELERIIDVAKMANAYDFISLFENGFDTVVGDRGVHLSGGQKLRE